MSKLRLCLSYLAVASLTACGGGGTTTDDAGPMVGNDSDQGTFACEQPMQIAGEDDGRFTSVMIDTDAMGFRPRDLGFFCGNPAPSVRWARQVVVEYTVPGTAGDGKAVSFRTTGNGTPRELNTVVQVRSSCDRIPEDGVLPGFSFTTQTVVSTGFPFTCFDNSGPTPGAPDVRAEGTFQATAGETLFFVVTGYSEDGFAGTESEGMVNFEIAATDSSPPSLDGVRALVLGDDITLVFDGADPDSDVRGILMDFRLDGQVVDVYGNAPATTQGAAFLVDRQAGQISNIMSIVNGAGFPVSLTEAPPRSGSGTMTINAQSGLVPTNPPISLAEFIEANMFNGFGIQMYDEAFNLTPLQVVTLEEGMQVGFGEECGGASGAICVSPLVCTDGACAASAGATDTCMNTVTPIEITVEPGQFATAQQDVRIPGGPSFFSPPSCVEAGQAESSEAVFSVDLPESPGLWDLIITTDTEVTGDADTLLSIRADCVSPLSEVACSNDIIPDTNRASRIEARNLVDGDYFIVLERFTPVVVGSSLQVGMEITARPVRTMGDSCDVAGILDRCELGTTCQGGQCIP